MTVAVAAGLEWFHVVAMLATGTLAGLLGGLLGIGGGLVMIPAMYLILSDSYGLDSFHLYKLAAITTSIVVSIPAAIRHARVRALVYPLLFSIVPLALLGVIVGVWLASWFADEYTHLLRRTFGGFIILVVVVNVYRARRAAAGDARLGETCPSPRRWGLIGWLVGFPAGVI
ncbi:MAG: TSUP family transporter, partial [Planctomycetes bacterium]|nr:TSUP family transporter [Planctomycetota bacterium]